MPVLRDEWREPLRAQRDPLAEDSGRARSNRDERRRWRKQTLARPLRLDLRLAGLRAAGARRADRRGGLPDRHRNQRAGTAEADGTGAGPADHRRGQHGDHRRAAQGADAVRRQPAHRHPARRRPVHRGGRQDLAHRARHRPAGRRGHRQGVHLHRRGRGRRRHHRVRRRRRLRADGQRDAGQPEELDAQPAVRVHPDRRARRARLPGVADARR